MHIKTHSRGTRAHDAVLCWAVAVPVIVVVHAQVVAQLMSHDGGEGDHLVVGELQREAVSFH